MKRVQTSPTFTINEPLATDYYQALVDLKRRLKLEGDVTLEHLMAMGDIIQPAETTNNSEDCWEIIMTCLSSGLSDLANMRQNEGELLAVDINDRLTFIENNLSRIEKIFRRTLGPLPEAANGSNTGAD